MVFVHIFENIKISMKRAFFLIFENFVYTSELYISRFFLITLWKNRFLPISPKILTFRGKTCFFGITLEHVVEFFLSISHIIACIFNISNIPQFLQAEAYLKVDEKDVTLIKTFFAPYIRNIGTSWQRTFFYWSLWKCRFLTNYQHF